MTLGLVASISLANGSVLNAVAMILLGLLLGTIGADAYSGTPVHVWLAGLADGIPIVAFGAGLYGITEILSTGETERTRRSSRRWAA